MNKQKKYGKTFIIFMSVLVFSLVLGLGIFKSVSKINKIKGLAIECSEIPAQFKPYNAESNPSGLHEYGFEDINFYSTVVSNIYKKNNTATCINVTEDELSNINYFTNYFDGQNNSETIKLNDLNGIEYLKSLKDLNISQSAFQEINLSNNVQLTSLSIYSDNLQEIDLSNNLNLKNINIGSNNLIYVNLDGLSNVTSMQLQFKELENLNLKDNQNLFSLSLVGKKIANDLDLSTLNNLEELTIFGYDWDGSMTLSSLDLSNTGIYDLGSVFVSVNNIDLSGMESLHSASLDSSNLTSINLSNTPSLEFLSLADNKLENINLSDNTNITFLDLSNNNFDNINLSNNINLNSLNLSKNNFDNINLSDNSNITFLDLSNNNFNNINLSNNINLNSLDLSYNKINNIDLSTNNKITSFNLSNNAFNNSIYMQKKTIADIGIKLNSNIQYTINGDVVTYNNGIITAVKEGEAKFTFGLAQILIKVYDLNSSSNEINYKDKTIDANGKDLDINKITLSPSSLTGQIDGNKYVIKDGDIVVDTYTIYNGKNTSNNGTGTVGTTTVNETETKDNSLSSLVVNNSEIKLIINKKNYYVKIDKNTDKLDIDAITKNPNSKVTIDGNKNLKNGSKVKIKVTTEDGDTRVYTLNVQKPGSVSVWVIFWLVISLLFISGVLIYQKLKNKIFILIIKDKAK